MESDSPPSCRSPKEGQTPQPWGRLCRWDPGALGTQTHVAPSRGLPSWWRGSQRAEAQSVGWCRGPEGKRGLKLGKIMGSHQLRNILLFFRKEVAAARRLCWAAGACFPNLSSATREQTRRPAEPTRAGSCGTGRGSCLEKPWGRGGTRGSLPSTGGHTQPLPSLASTREGPTFWGARDSSRSTGDPGREHAAPAALYQDQGAAGTATVAGSSGAKSN